MSELTERELEEQVSIANLLDHTQSPRPGQRLQTRLHTLSPSERREVHIPFPASPQSTASPQSPWSPSTPSFSMRFEQDFDQYCSRVLPRSSLQGFDFPSLCSLLEALHLVNPEKAVTSRLIQRFWDVLVRPGALYLPIEDVRKALKSILGITPETSPIWSSVLKSFQSFAVNRCRYVSLEAPQALFSPNKENSLLGTSPKSSKPQLPLGRDPAVLMRDRPSLSPVRFPTLRKPLATVKINLTPTKSEILRLYRGDNLKEAVALFSSQHKLKQSESAKLLRALETQLRK